MLGTRLIRATHSLASPILSNACAILLFYASIGMAQQVSSRTLSVANPKTTGLLDAGTVAGEYCAPFCPIDWVGDGICDETCWVPECNYDGGDCGDCAPGCPYEWIGDGYCDEVCLNAPCNQDGGDCPDLCAPGCPYVWVGDIYCDSTCNNAACSFDGGDCSLHACCSPNVTAPECASGTPLACLTVGGAPRIGQACPADCPLCDAPCVWCWTGTAFENNCNPTWNGDGECDCDCQFQDVDCPAGARTLLSSNPAACIIDARIPHLPNAPIAQRGYASIVLTFDGPAGATEDGPADYTVEPFPGPPPVPPTIVGVTTNTNTATLTFSGPIQANQWTCIRHNASNKRACLGFLPADAGSNRAAGPSDILDLIDNLNGIRVPALALHQCDIDRSGACAPADIIAEIDLLNGVNLFPVQNGRTLPACPYSLP